MICPSEQSAPRDAHSRPAAPVVWGAKTALARSLRSWARPLPWLAATHSALGFAPRRSHLLKSSLSKDAPLAQLAEQLALNQRVGGSIPSWRTSKPRRKPGLFVPPGAGSLAAQVRDRVWVELLAELLAELDRPPNVCRPSDTLARAKRWQTCANAGKPGAVGTKPGQPPNVCQPLDTFATASDWQTCLNPGKTTPGSPQPDQPPHVCQHCASLPQPPLPPPPLRALFPQLGASPDPGPNRCVTCPTPAPPAH